VSKSAAKTTRRKGQKPGPYSGDDAIAQIDRRTSAGRVLRTVEADLTADLGGDPTTAERLLIQSIAVKATRLHLLSERLLDADEPGEDGHHALAWFNSMRLDLQAIGLQRRTRDVTPTLADYLASKAAGAGTP
jgi:hypothetical protein